MRGTRDEGRETRDEKRGTRSEWRGNTRFFSATRVSLLATRYSFSVLGAWLNRRVFFDQEPRTLNQAQGRFFFSSIGVINELL